MITLEDLKMYYNSCFSCGVSWHEDHVSLDCLECGGYALQRPCPECDGKCASVWQRDLAASHATKGAKWEGKCLLNSCKQMARLAAEDHSKYAATFKATPSL